MVDDGVWLIISVDNNILSEYVNMYLKYSLTHGIMFNGTCMFETKLCWFTQTLASIFWPKLFLNMVT